MIKEKFEASEQVWGRLIESINNPPARKNSLLQKEIVTILSMAVFCMFFVNYETIKKSDLNNFIYTTYHQLANPNDSSFTLDAWTKISAKLQKEE